MNTAIPSAMEIPVSVSEQFPPNQRKKERVIVFNFRWQVFQTDKQTVEVRIPTGGPDPILNPKLVEAWKMSNEQVEKHENAILRDVCILPE